MLYGNRTLLGSRESVALAWSSKNFSICFVTRDKVKHVYMEMNTSPRALREKRFSSVTHDCHLQPTHGHLA